MGAEPRWLREDDLIRINQLVVAATGEPHGILEANRIANVASAPRNTFHYGETDDLVELAVRLLAAIAQNYPFQQGNKRTAFAAAVLFLERNGCIVALPDRLDIAREVEALVERRIGPEALLVLFRRHVVLPAQPPSESSSE